ncbi:MAG: hypothetical protein K8F62_12440 [Pseudorhodoplanes sp.]|nr:hypothetical protein [Pseudorhodoplanes sp.]
MSGRLLLVVSNSYDTTADLLVHRLGPDKVFRFNFDIWSDYTIEITLSGFRIVDPVGRSADSENIAKVLWRKPWSRGPYRPTSLTDEDRYYDQEVWYAVRDIVNLLWRDGKIVLVEPYAERRAGKFVQMRIAAKHLRVPPFQFRLRRPSVFADPQMVVVKSLTSETVGPVEERELLFTTKVDDSALSPDCPWMVQSYVDADKDVTVAFVYDRLFAFELDRIPFRELTADWREMPTDREGSEWRPHRLPEDVSRSIFAFMHEMGLQFGRLDFLKGSNGYYFLEVNTNGEWAWLDTQGCHGLLLKVVMEVDPDNVLHSIPVRGLLDNRSG